MQATAVARQSHYPQIYLINPDPISASVVRGMLGNANIHSRNFESPSQLLRALPLSSPACLMFDFVMPEMSGLQLMQTLRSQRSYHPCILASSRVEPEHIVQAMNRGAFGFIKRPFQPLELIEMVQDALRLQQVLHPLIDEATAYQRQCEALSQRERQVLMQLEMGRSARDAAAELGLSYRTVENHRLRMFRKLGIASSVELIQRVTTLRVLRASRVMD